MAIGLKNNNNDYIRLKVEKYLNKYFIEYYYYTIRNKGKDFNAPFILWNNCDIFGCGLVYPPEKMSDQLPYVFFTHNGRELGKAISLKDASNNNNYRPFICLESCSIETNFGDNLKVKPFYYNIYKHDVDENILKSQNSLLY
uniref:SCP domain-containing protein n=1 Tax=Meloidogyne hapla TaxID=6305 RepID=A0A1I8BWA9_MELHA